MARNGSDKIYSATYSNVPVYEFNASGNHVMRRRSDDWINATHILKVAGYDKPTRTRILEREVQKGVHEKVQGGYGKYQGTWISLEDGRDLATKNNVLEELLPILDFIPGDRTPPPAPKHITAASVKPRQPRSQPQPRRQLAYGQVPAEYDQMDTSMCEQGTPDNADMYSESAFDDYDNSQFTNSRKRRRVDGQLSQADREHHLWAEELLDYFMMQDNPLDSLPNAPIPPSTIDLDRPIDDKGHTAIHWAAAMGDVELVKDFIRRGAKIDVHSKAGETPLMRAVLFTNSFDRQNMDKLAHLLIRTVNIQEWTASNTVFHHVANTTERKSKYACARYYMDCLLHELFDHLSAEKAEQILNYIDANGDTAITIAARNGARKCVRSLLSRHAALDIVNQAGETADHLIVALNNRRQERLSTANRQLSSSPVGEGHPIGAIGGAVQTPNGIPFELASSRVSMKDHHSNMPEVYKSESALTVTSQIIPSFFDKARTLAEALEAEIMEKDAELQEAHRLANMRRAELEELRNKQEELRLKEIDYQSREDAKTNEELMAEIEQLTKECEDLTRAEEDMKLRELYHEERAKMAAAAGEKYNPDDDEDEVFEFDENDPQAEAIMRERLEAARDLSNAWTRRNELIREIVQALSVAGVGNMHHQYRRLLSGCLNLREEDVQGMLPDIVEELQQARELESKGA